MANVLKGLLDALKLTDEEDVDDFDESFKLYRSQNCLEGIFQPPLPYR